MALNLWKVAKGLAIQEEGFASEVHILQGAGLPGGDAGEQDSAPVGSLYLQNVVNTEALQLFSKFTTINSSQADWKQLASKEYIDAIVLGLSWREPVKVLDSTNYANPAAFPITGVIDGITLVDGDRVLFTDVTTGTDENIFIWNAGTTSWVEDSNAESDGDAVLIKDGSGAEQQWTYDGTDWILFGSAAGAAELAYIRTYIGKTGAGPEMPTYASTFVVTQAGGLEVAIGELDAAFGDNAAYTEQNVVTNGETITSSIDAIDVSLGDFTYAEQNVVTDGEDHSDSIDALDIAIGDLNSQTTIFNSTNITTSTPIDIIPAADVDMIHWMVIAKTVSDSTKREGVEVIAILDGTSTTAGIDFSRAPQLNTGGTIGGLRITTDISAGNLRLIVESPSNAVDVTGKRIGFINF